MFISSHQINDQIQLKKIDKRSFLNFDNSIHRSISEYTKNAFVIFSSLPDIGGVEISQPSVLLLRQELIKIIHEIKLNHNHFFPTSVSLDWWADSKANPISENKAIFYILEVQDLINLINELVQLIDLTIDKGNYLSIMGE
jgi:hypothetical protein